MPVLIVFQKSVFSITTERDFSQKADLLALAYWYYIVSKII
jgi:hypothetical protein